MMLEKVSVIVITHNREAVLRTSIQKILEQDYENFELVVVDRTERHTRETEVFLENNKSSIRYFEITKPGIPRARNLGLSNALGDIVIFLDDDIEPPPDLISRHVEKYKNPEVGGVTGRILEKNNTVHRFNKKIGYITAWGRNIGNRSLDKECFVKTAFGGNMSFKKEYMQDVGIFDVNYAGSGTLEETDYSYRFRKITGKKILFSPDAVLLHFPQRDGSEGEKSSKQIEFYHNYFHNLVLFFLKNMPFCSYPLCLIRLFALSVYRGLFQTGSLRNSLYLFRGVGKGVSTYMASRCTRNEKSF